MSSSPKPTVLIVEDEALIAMSIEIQLQDMGYKTLVVSSIEAATAALAQRAIDLAILDYKLRDGEKTTPVAEALHERRIPFVVCSGSQFNDMAAIFEGVTVVPKPYTEDLLASAVSGALATRH
jgi:CheY-like chemotaxis protein